MAVVRKKLGRAAISLGPDLPVEGAWIWGAFCALDDTRDVGMGIGAITFAEMMAYAQLCGFRWTPVEIAIVRRLDRAFRVFQAGRQHQHHQAAKAR